jgi:hypothetical protein
MSGTLELRFDSNVPVAAVEVVAPDLQIVGRAIMSAGAVRSFQVPSEASFIRVHLTSGQVVTLRDPGNLNRLIKLDQIRPQLSARHERKVRLATDESLLPRALEKPRSRSWTSVDRGETATLASGDEAYVEGSNARVEVSRRRDKARWTFTGSRAAAPVPFILLTKEGVTLRMALPPSVKKMQMEVPIGSSRPGLVLSIESEADTPDAMLAYMARGDLYSAMAGESWTEQAADLVMGKIQDPYSAAIGAYVLLRLGHTEKMKDWAKNLADWFPFLSDGCIIWAWQKLRGGTSEEDEVAHYLEQAVNRGLPVYTEGVRLLMDGLRLIGKRGEAARGKVDKLAPEVIWSSPLTAVLTVTAGTTPVARPRIEVRYG